MLGKWVKLVRASFNGADYTAQNDANSTVEERFVNCFACHAQDTPDLTVAIAAGFLNSGSGLADEIAAQSVGPIAAPSTHDRITLIYIDPNTGGAGGFANGSESTTPVAPALPAGCRQVALILMHTGTTAIDSTLIGDVRTWGSAGRPAAEDSIASAATCDIGSLGTSAVLVTGATGPITSLGSAGDSANPYYFVRFSGAPTLTHNATALILPGGVNIVAAAGDAMVAQYISGSNWRVVAFFRGDAPPAIPTKTIRANITGATARDTPSTLTAILDAFFGTTRGGVLVRGASAWAMQTGTNGQALMNNGADAVFGAPAVGAGAVHQGSLSIGGGSVTASSGASGEYILPGGLYGFYPQVSTSAPGGDYGGFSAGIWMKSANSSFGGADPLTTDHTTVGSQATYIYLSSTNGGTMTAVQYYVNASPPYDLGDGPTQGFIFALVERGTGKVLGTYAAVEPPWVYNGPTNVVPTRIDDKGRKFRTIRKRSITLADVKAKRASLKEFHAASAELAEQEITQAVYNADMPLFPHPFVSVDEKKNLVVLLDPMHDLVGKLLAEQTEGSRELAGLLHDGHLKIGNTPLARRGPPGVMQAGIDL